MNLQQVVQTIYTKFSNAEEYPEGKKSTNSYETSSLTKGTGCAIGCLVSTDIAKHIDEYCSRHNTYTIDDLYELYSDDDNPSPIMTKFITLTILEGYDYDANTLYSIQRLHDASSSKDAFLQDLKDFAAFNRLVLKD